MDKERKANGWEDKKRRRVYGEHLTPSSLFQEYVLPDLLPLRTHYRWVDLFAGAGNLIFPLLDQTPHPERIEFFREHIFLYDIQPEMVKLCVQKAIQLGIPEKLARQNIRCQDTLATYPQEIVNSRLPVCHITNPPYLYLGYIAKHQETERHLNYFKGGNEGYQDLYQIALMNDLRHNIPKMIYIIPTNFLFGYSNSNKIRLDFLPFYEIEKVIILEKSLFKDTGVHVAICFFKRKTKPTHETQTFEGLKIGSAVQTRLYRLSPTYNYRAGTEFEEFTTQFRTINPLKVRYYLHQTEIEQHPGNHPIRLVDANDFVGKEYRQFTAHIDENLFTRIKANPLFVRTLDSGRPDGRAGLYIIPEVYKADGIVITRFPYRTHPIHIFLEPTLPYEDIILLRDYFNLILEHFRALTDSEFLTTYKYSKSTYTRKYLGLSQAKALIETFPYQKIGTAEYEAFKEAVKKQDAAGVIEILKTFLSREHPGDLTNREDDRYNKNT